MSLLELFAFLLRCNALTFGNGTVMIPILQKRLVEDTGVLTIDQFLYAFAVAGVTPGQANLYVASVGYMLFGMAGAVVAVFAIQAPGYLMILFIKSYQRFEALGFVRDFTRGLTAASVGLIFATTISLGRSSLTLPSTWVVFALMLGLAYLLKWNVLLSLATASTVGLILHLWL